MRDIRSCVRTAAGPWPRRRPATAEYPAEPAVGIADRAGRRVADALRDTDERNALAADPAEAHILVVVGGVGDDPVRPVDIAITQNVLGPDEAPCLRLHGDTRGSAARASSSAAV